MFFKSEGSVDDITELIFTFLSCFDLKVYLKSGGHGFVGKGSAHFLKRFKTFNKYNQTFAEKNQFLRFDVGRYNDFAECKILIGGEHNNDQFLNYSFGDNPIIRKYIESTYNSNFSHIDKGVFIGHYNIFSFDTLILDGAKIGTGNIFGARSLVLKSSAYDNWCIYGGNPVKIKKRRNISFPVDKIDFNAVNFGDFLKYIETKDYKHLINEARDIGKLVIEYDERSPKFEVRVLGFEIRDLVITADDFPEEIKDYFRLMQDSESKKALVDESLFARYMK